MGQSVPYFMTYEDHRQTCYIDYFSLPSVRLEMLSDTGMSLGFATGFHVIHKARFYLVTNWHVVTGKDPETGSKLGTAPPAFLNAAMQGHPPAPGNSHVKRLELYSKDYEPLWIEHPIDRLDGDHGKPDVVVLRLPQDLSGLGFWPMPIHDEINDLLLIPGSTLHVVGFPWGLTGSGLLPLWITAFVASDRESQPDLPFFFSSGMTTPAMSGSPVVFRAAGSVMTKSNTIVSFLERPTAFQGVYSGRLRAGSSSDDSHVGKIWSRKIVFDVLENDKT
jgi:hypothetical protein